MFVNSVSKESMEQFMVRDLMRFVNDAYRAITPLQLDRVLVSRVLQVANALPTILLSINHAAWERTIATRVKPTAWLVLLGNLDHMKELLYAKIALEEST